MIRQVHVLNFPDKFSDEMNGGKEQEWLRKESSLKRGDSDAVLFLFLDPENLKDVYKQRTKGE